MQVAQVQMSVSNEIEPTRVGVSSFSDLGM